MYISCFFCFDLKLSPPSCDAYDVTDPVRPVGRSSGANSSNLNVCRIRWPRGFSGFPLNQIKIADNDCGLHTLQLLALASSVGADWILGGLPRTTVPKPNPQCPSFLCFRCSVAHILPGLGEDRTLLMGDSGGQDHHDQRSQKRLFLEVM